MRHASFAPARRTFLLVLLFVTAAIATVSTGYAQSVVASTIDTATLDPRTGNVTVTGTVTRSETAVLEVLVTVRQSPWVGQAHRRGGWSDRHVWDQRDGLYGDDGTAARQRPLPRGRGEHQRLCPTLYRQWL